MTALRFTGPLATLGAGDRAALLDRAPQGSSEVAGDTARIIADVRARGDAALREMARLFDRVELDALEVPRREIQLALDRTPAPLRRALERAASNIQTVHRAFMPAAIEVSPEPGIVVGRRPDALERVGVYAPGGRANYPSSVLMGAVPARAAGVRTVIVCSPPDASGLPPRIALAAAAVARADRVFAVGGAGAIAAMAFGTESVPRVDAIVGPGNAYVAAAKLQLAHTVAIDSPAGPSELLLIADAAADAERIAREMIAQAEHDPWACVVAIVTSEAQARCVEQAVFAQLASSPRRGIVESALGGNGGILVADSVEAALDFSADYAPEHLLIDARNAVELSARVRNAGTVFLGGSSSVAFGDYMTGANHVLPTGGSARAYSGLSPLNFVRWTTVQRVDAAAAAGLAGDVALLARAEGLPGHAAAALGSGSGGGTVLGSRRVGAFTRPEFDDIQLYDPDRRPARIDLSDNTNRWGMPPAARDALRDAGEWSAVRYPALYAHELKRALARYIGVDVSNVVTGCGSDDVLDSAIRVCGRVGGVIAAPTPVFPMIPLFARMNGLSFVSTPLGACLGIDVDTLVASDPDIVYLCSPNNPTGTTLPRSVILDILERTRGLVIVDEAYIEFGGASVVDLAMESPRLLVVRTMSKAFGLAGLRVGYAIGAPDLVAAVEKSRGPYKVSAPAERAAIAALTDGLSWTRERVADVITLRATLSDELVGRGLVPLPSSANFVLVPVANADDLAAMMRDMGVAVRPFTRLASDIQALRATDGSALRISIGPRAELDAALAALGQARAACE